MSPGGRASEFVAEQRRSAWVWRLLGKLTLYALLPMILLLFAIEWATSPGECAMRWTTRDARNATEALTAADRAASGIREASIAGITAISLAATTNVVITVAPSAWKGTNARCRLTDAAMEAALQSNDGVAVPMEIRVGSAPRRAAVTIHERGGDRWELLRDNPL